MKKLISIIRMKSMPVTNVSVTRGDENGEINITWDSLRHAELYVIQYGTGSRGDQKEDVSWKVADIINESNYTIKGLKKSKTYLFRVAAVTAKKQGPWSRTVKKSIDNN
ncbi:MAG: fibronectin type III domain-containing protein [Ignavibacteria bacterium]|nr:fibronectin type III domain-containing protein [Ignavibacteria bacterium]